MCLVINDTGIKNNVISILQIKKQRLGRVTSPRLPRGQFRTWTWSAWRQRAWFGPLSYPAALAEMWVGFLLPLYLPGLSKGMIRTHCSKANLRNKEFETYISSESNQINSTYCHILLKTKFPILKMWGRVDYKGARWNLWGWWVGSRFWVLCWFHRCVRISKLVRAWCSNYLSIQL